jgi:nitrogen fixation NifU-like protein
MYNPAILDHFEKPRNVGEISDATAVAEVTNPACGDILKLWVRLENGKVADVKFKVSGCVPSVACGSVLTEMMKGKSIAEVGQIGAAEIERALEGLPSASQHAGVLAADALKAVLAKL